MENNEKNVQDKQEVESTKMQKAGKIKTIILMLILLILVLAVGIGIGYVLSDKKIINKMDESTPTIQENEENVNEQYTLKMEKDKEYVYDAKYESNVSEDLYESEYLNDIKVPYININSEDAAKANDEIKEIYKKEINKYTKGALDEGSTIAECEYQYYINDNVLSIVLTVKSEDLVTYNYYTYNFSLNTGKKLEYNEIYEKAGLNSSNIDSKVESAITEKMREMMNNFDDVNYPEGTSFSTYNNESKNNYIKSVSNNSLNYFLSKDGNLNVVIALSIPAGLGETNTIIEITNTINETSATSDKNDNGLINNDADNYNKYIGTWVDENNSSELNVLTIGNNQLAFSWTIYRIAGIDNVVVPMENNKAVFYYQGYDDKNYNSKQDEGEYYYRRATIQLNTESININIENITSSEYDITKARDFDGSVYVDEGTYTYNINKNNEQSEITREDALELGEKMYKEVEGYYKKMSEIHPNNFVQTTETAETMAKIEDNTFMENVKKLLIKDAFNNFMEYYHIEDRNGEYYASTGGMGNNPLYISTNDLTIKNMDNYTITYIATSVYDDIDYTGTETKDYEFVLTKIDGEWKVENFTLPY